MANPGEDAPKASEEEIYAAVAEAHDAIERAKQLGGPAVLGFIGHRVAGPYKGENGSQTGSHYVSRYGEQEPLAPSQFMLIQGAERPQQQD